MWPKLRVAQGLPVAWMKALDVFECDIVDDQEVHVVCSASTAVIVVPESDLMCGTQHVLRLVEALTVFPNPVVCYFANLADMTSVHELQMAFVRLRLKAVPVTSYKEAAELCERLRKGKSEKAKPVEKTVADALSSIPNVSKKRALLLSDKFKSLKRVVEASADELHAVVGKVASESIVKFFREECNYS